MRCLSSCNTGTYFLLNAENYHWQWTPFVMSSSTSLYVFLYVLCPERSRHRVICWIIVRSSLIFFHTDLSLNCPFRYALHYFLFKTKMTGLLQTCFYFGCAADISYIIPFRQTVLYSSMCQWSIIDPL